MNLVDLFAGIGGVSLAADWAGIDTVAFCEIDSFCQSILTKHWPGVPIFDDVKHLGAAELHAAGIDHIDILHASTPCQPFSTAGKRRGNEDERALWPEVLRIIDECRPRAVLIENVAGAVSLALDGWLTDLERAGYAAGTVLLPAAAVGAPHVRARTFVVGYAAAQRTHAALVEPRSQTSRIATQSDRPRISHRCINQRGLDGVADGISFWLDSIEPERITDEAGHRRRIQSLGNAVVPQQVYPILCTMRDALELSEVAA